jgi:hypothetical protein
MPIENNLKGEIYSHPLFLFIGQTTLWNYIKNLKYNRKIIREKGGIDNGRYCWANLFGCRLDRFRAIKKY